MENRENNYLKPTIVGVRPPEGRVDFRQRPIGIEILLKKASVDPGFRDMLISQRGKSAEAIFMQLEPEEEQILSAIPESQLIRMIEKSIVPADQKPAFEKYAAALMIAAMGLTPVLAAGCHSRRIPVEPIMLPTNTATATVLPPATPTATRTGTIQQSATPSATQTPTITRTVTNTGTPTITATSMGIMTDTPSPSRTVTQTATMTVTPSVTETCAVVASVTGTSTPTITATTMGTTTHTPTITQSRTVTSTPTIHTPSPSATTAGNTATCTPTSTQTRTITPTVTPTDTP